MRRFKNHDSDNLHSGLVCHVVSKTFLMCRNIAAMEILLFKFRVTLLNKYVICARGFLGRCRIYSFGIRPVPQSFLNFKDYVCF
jgi:hypothetical protein